MVRLSLPVLGWPCNKSIHVQCPPVLGLQFLPIDLLDLHLYWFSILWLNQYPSRIISKIFRSYTMVSRLFESDTVRSTGCGCKTNQCTDDLHQKHPPVWVPAYYPQQRRGGIHHKSRFKSWIAHLTRVDLAGRSMRRQTLNHNHRGVCLFNTDFDLVIGH